MSIEALDSARLLDFFLVTSPKINYVNFACDIKLQIKKDGIVVSKRRITFNLTDLEKKQLETTVKSRTAEQRMVVRCKIILMTEEGRTLSEIAGKLDISRTTANHWRHRYSLSRMEGLKDIHRSGRPWSFSSKERLKVITSSLQNSKDAAHLSSRGLAAKLKKEDLNISKSTVHRILANAKFCE